ncbi:16S rRNA (uracil(1498)-N(3))-methyltransferase [Alteribacter populi]|uniref:16S rRNA (uracil(1498)-N(3))-methyltransferase n=1 Tax=Alteribacter populi TaxID=2011011 RepID=UPI000BBA79EE|nr:16S rRNA (uracil(1498)-N(3))-methyltransferase [Alteribacter populi]
MQRYFLEETLFQDKYVIITGDDAKHIQKVMRMESGDNVICCNQSGECYTAELTEISTERVEATLMEKEEAAKEMPVHVTIAAGLPKADKLEWVIQKGTELGANGFIPFEAERSIVKWDQKKAKKKVDRWSKIAKEAAEQAHRQQIPSIEGVASLKDLLLQFVNYNHVLVAYEEEARNDEKSRLVNTLKATKDGENILLIVGPEGGFSDREIEDFSNQGAVSCALGPRILRAETAPLYALSAISYHFELLE